MGEHSGKPSDGRFRKEDGHAETQANSGDAADTAVPGDQADQIGPQGVAAGVDAVHEAVPGCLKIAEVGSGVGHSGGIGLLNVVDPLRAHQVDAHLGAAALVGVVGPRHGDIDAGAHLGLAAGVLLGLRRPHHQHVHHGLGGRVLLCAGWRFPPAALRLYRLAQRRPGRRIHLAKHVHAVLQVRELVHRKGRPNGAQHHVAVYRERHRAAGHARHAPGEGVARQRALGAFDHDLEREVLGDIQHKALGSTSARSTSGTAPLDRADGREQPLPVNAHQPTLGGCFRRSGGLGVGKRRETRRFRGVHGNEQIRFPAPSSGRGKRQRAPQAQRSQGAPQLS